LEREIAEQRAIVAQQAVTITKLRSDISRMAIREMDAQNRRYRLRRAIDEIVTALHAHEGKDEYQRGYLAVFHIIDEMRLDDAD